jgi:hypothetical protein
VGGGGGEGTAHTSCHRRENKAREKDNKNNKERNKKTRREKEGEAGFRSDSLYFLKTK